MSGMNRSSRGYRRASEHEGWVSGVQGGLLGRGFRAEQEGSESKGEGKAQRPCVTRGKRVTAPERRAPRPLGRLPLASGWQVGMEGANS